MSNLTNGTDGCIVQVALYTLVAAFVVMSLICLTGCKQTQYVPVETVRTERVEVHDTVTVNDSTARNDSTLTNTQMLLQKVDSAYLAMLGIINAPPEAWLLQMNTTTKHTSNETASHKEQQTHSSDSVRTKYVEKPYPVPAQLSRWQKFCCDYGKIMLGASAALAILLLIILLYWIRYRRNQKRE